MRSPTLKLSSPQITERMLGMGLKRVQHATRSFFFDTSPEKGTRVPMTLVANLRARAYNRVIQERVEQYAHMTSNQTRQEYQLHLWNQEWRRIAHQVPYYKELKRRAVLPDSFRSWQEFVDHVPVSTRRTVKMRIQDLTSAGAPPDFYRITGGSTGEPIQLPAWNHEVAFTRPDMWTARHWYGISPASRMFTIWGHSHLLGAGIKGWLNARKRESVDRLLGYYRFSAYDLNSLTLQKAGDELLRFRPHYLVGYSVALDRFARANLDRSANFRDLGLKVVIATAESFPEYDSRSLLSDMFQCPVAMEYGSVETAVMAHSHPSGGYRVFWRTYFIEAERLNPAGDEFAIRVTSLYPRKFPLVRYDIGDMISLGSDTAERAVGIDHFEAVQGRCNDFVKMTNGALIHSEAFTHAIRSCRSIDGYQVIQRENSISVYYTARQTLLTSEVNMIRSRLKIIHPDLEYVVLCRVEQLEQTVAGKTPMIVSRK